MAVLERHGENAMQVSAKLNLQRFSNSILQSLNERDAEQLLPHLKLVRLPQDELLYSAGDEMHKAYFIESGMVSLLVALEDGRVSEVAMIGNEGIVGVPIILGVPRILFHVVVQLPTVAYGIKSSELRRALDTSDTLKNLALGYTHALMMHIAQSAVCNNFHRVEARLARWLLTAHDRLDSDSFHLTHECVSQMIGAPRSSVTDAAGALQRAKLIRYTRGQMMILDRAGLERASCECYGIIRKSLADALKS